MRIRVFIYCLTNFTVHPIDETNQTKRPAMLFRRCHTRHSGFFNFERKLIMTKTSIAAIAIALTSVLAGQAMAADQAADTKTSQQVAAATATAKAVSETQTKASTDAFAELDKVKKW
jgi:hypothetical protein